MKKIELIDVRGRSQFTLAIFHIFDHQHTLAYNFYAVNVYKFSEYFTIHPTRIVKVNCERPLKVLVWIHFLKHYETEYLKGYM